MALGVEGTSLNGGYGKTENPRGFRAREALQFAMKNYYSQTLSEM